MSEFAASWWLKYFNIVCKSCGLFIYILKGGGFFEIYFEDGATMQNTWSNYNFLMNINIVILQVTNC